MLGAVREGAKCRHEMEQDAGTTQRKVSQLCARDSARSNQLHLARLLHTPGCVYTTVRTHERLHEQTHTHTAPQTILTHRHTRPTRSNKNKIDRERGEGGEREGRRVSRNLFTD